MSKLSKRRPAHSESDFRLEALEARVLFSADSAVLVGSQGLPADEHLVASGVDSAHAALLAVPDDADEQTRSESELVIFDAGASDQSARIASLANREHVSGVVSLDAGEDALGRLSELIGESQRLTAVHLVAHSTEGELLLGGERVTHLDLLARASEIVGWRDAFAKGAQIQIHANELAASANGKYFVDTLSQLTATEVAVTHDVFASAREGSNAKLQPRSLVNEDASSARLIAPRISLAADPMADTGLLQDGTAFAISTPASVTGDEDTILVFEGTNVIQVNDGYTTDTPLQVALSVANGRLSLASSAQIHFVEGEDGSASMVIEGLESDINTALNGLVFTPDDGFSGGDTLSASLAIAADLQGYYTFENHVLDQSAGVASNGAIEGGAGFVNDAERGVVLGFDGVDDRVVLSPDITFTDQVTLSAWVNVPSTTTEAQFVISLSNDVVLNIRTDGRAEGIYRYSGGSNWNYTSGTENITGTGWRHIVYTLDSTAQRIYVDGVLETETSFIETNAQSTNSHVFGQNTTAGVNRFAGLMDDVRVYSRALSADEIAGLAIDQFAALNSTAISITPINESPVFNRSDTPSFNTNDITATADGASAATSGDVDGDGDLDVVSASFSDASIIWYENDGTGNFSSQIIASDALGATSVATSDVDGDGDLDVLSASYNDNKIAWYRNDGNGNFTTHVITLNADAAYSVAAADVDGDGDMDVLSASQSDNTIAWYENDGSENFTTRIITSTAGGAVSVTTSDVDGDGDLDVLSASNSDNEIIWYENDGAQNFISHVITGSAQGARSVSSADVDGDGDIDVLSASFNDHAIRWYENDGTENFTVHDIATNVGSAFAVSTADVDSDGDLDVLSAAMSNGVIAWYENDGSESFTLQTIATDASGARWVSTGDIDGDGDLDVLSASFSDDRVAWYENNLNTLDGNPTFVEDGSAVLLDTNVVVSDEELDALNGGNGNYSGAALTIVRNGEAMSDDSFDFIDGSGVSLIQGNLFKNSQIIASFDTSSVDGMLTILFDDSGGVIPDTTDISNVLRQITYQNSSDAPPDSVQLDWVFSDGNQGAQGEGGAQQASGNTVVHITTLNDSPAFIATGTTVFSSNELSPVISGAMSVTAVDLDTDGDLDVLSASVEDSRISWHENDGNQNYTLHVIDASLSETRTISSADIDDDGDLDVLSVSFNGDQIIWYENDGSENFTAQLIPPGVDGPYSVTTADVDEDGDIDVLSASLLDDTIAWFENDGSENFIINTISSNADGAVLVSVADIDGDGDIDVLSASEYDDKIAWYQNDGGESFTENVISTTADGALFATLEDVDSDGDIDVLSASNNDDKIAWYENDGSGNFTMHIVSTSADGANSVTAADIDGDGDVDIVSGSSSDSMVTLYRNDGSENFTSYTVASDAVGMRSVVTADMDSDGDLDVLSASLSDNGLVWYENNPDTVDGNPTFGEGEEAVRLDEQVSLSDAELDSLNSGDGNYAGAVITIARNVAADSDDVLGFVDGNGLTHAGGQLIKNSQAIASFDTTSTTGELTITFTDLNGEIPTSLDVSNALSQLSYANTSDSPPSSVELIWTFDDGNTAGLQGGGGALDVVDSTTVNILNIPDIDITAPATVSVSEDTVFVYSGANVITVDDETAADTVLQVTLSVANGSLELNDVNGITFIEGGNGTSAMVIEALESALNTALNGLRFTPTEHYIGADRLNITAAVASELQGHYTFESNAENAGAAVGSDGVFLNGALIVSDAERGQVLSLNNQNQYVEIAGMFGNPADLTLAAWVDVIPGTENDEVISLGNNVVLRSSPDGSGLNVVIRGSSSWQTIHSNINIAGAGWTHVAATISGSTGAVSIYIDGVEVKSDTAAEPIYYTRGPNTRIGMNGEADLQPFNGLIDDVRIYSRVLSAAEIASLAGSDSVVIDVVAVNNAPVMDNSGNPELADITEDEVNNNGQTVASILASVGNPVSDANGDPLGIAVINALSGSLKGVFHYSLDAGASWQQISSIDSNTALLLRDTDLIRFEPRGHAVESAAIEFRAWDQTTGTAGSVVDTSVTGGSSAFSAAVESATITTTSINDAPTFGVLPGLSVENFSDGADRNDARVVRELSDGRLIAVHRTTLNGQYEWILVRYLANGTLDRSFGSDGWVATEFSTTSNFLTDLVVQADGKYILGGSAGLPSDRDYLLLRYNADGTLDETFGAAGVFTLASTGQQDIRDITLQVDADNPLKENVLILGRVGADIEVLRVDGDTGVLDTEFGNGGATLIDLGEDEYANAFAVDSANRILITGRQDLDAFVARLTVDGDLDSAQFSTLASGGNGGYATTRLGGTYYADGQSILVKDNGQIVIAGNSNVSGNANTSERDAVALALFNQDGTLDTGFGSGGTVRTTIAGEWNYGLRVPAIAEQADGKLVIAGYAYLNDTDVDMLLVRYNADGSLDDNFAEAGILIPQIDSMASFASDVVVSSDQTLLVAGGWASVDVVFSAIARFDHTGMLVPSFQSGILDETPVYTEGGLPVVLDHDVLVFDRELSGNDFAGSSLVLVRDGGAEAQDIFSDSGLLSPLVEGESLTYDGVAIGFVVSNSGGMLRLEFTNGADNRLVNDTLRSIAYANSSENPPQLVNLVWTFDDGNSGAQGGGGSGQAIGYPQVTIVGVNSAPSVTLNTGMTISQGGRSLISADMLAAADADDADSSIEFHITNPAQQGQLETSSDAGVALASFTFQQVQDGEIVYQHFSNSDADDNFVFEVRDGGEDTVMYPSDTFLVSVVSNSLSATDDTFSMISGTPIVIDVLENDADAQGDVLSVIEIIDTAGGEGVSLLENSGDKATLASGTTIELRADNRLTVVAFADGIESFDYRVSDGAENETASVTLNTMSDQATAESIGFVTTWNTSQSGTSASDTIALSVNNGSENYTVFWGDGSSSTAVAGDVSHTYAVAGNYTIAIVGDFAGFAFGDSGDANKLISIDQWGNVAFENWSDGFEGASNVIYNASDVPDLTGVTSLADMFRESAFNGDIGDWDVSGITNMRGMFQNNITFNQDISGWETGSLTTMQDMFRNAAAFNQDINTVVGGGNTGGVAWDVSNVMSMVNGFFMASAFDGDISDWDTSMVTSMDRLFRGATSFNGDISNWDTRAVASMVQMFSGASIFNKDIGGWETGNVISMSQMFREAETFSQNINTVAGGGNNGGIAWDTSSVTNMSRMFEATDVFNSDIGHWDTSHVSDMYRMFYSAKSFNHNVGVWNTASLIDAIEMFNGASQFDHSLGDWNISLITSMSDMLSGSDLSLSNYDDTLIKWQSQNVQGNVQVGASGLRYDEGAGDRQRLIDEHGWEFSGDTIVDTDKDEVGDYFDLDDDNDGLLDTVEQYSEDTDGDGVIDRKDLDSDNDGISDLNESGTDVQDLDIDGNGIIDGLAFVDGDADGLADSLELENGENSGAFVPDTDNDGIRDNRDLDSDDDGISDWIESQDHTNYTGNDGDITDDDGDGDGVIAAFDNNDSSAASFGGSFTSPIDTDNDGLADYTDTDTDGDGRLDRNESGLSLSGEDANGDGIDDHAPIGASYADPDGELDDPANDVSAAYRAYDNNIPLFTALVGGSSTFVEDNEAIVMDADVSVSDTELDALAEGEGNYAGATLTVARTGASDSDDVLSFIDGNGITLSGASLIKNSNIIATFDTITRLGELQIGFTDANGEIPATADVINILRQLSYFNSNNMPPASVQITWTFDDGNAGGQGTGGSLSITGSTTIDITSTNDTPIITSSSAVDVVENQEFILTLLSSDVDGGIPIYTISGGEDSELFSIDADSGKLSFATAPDFETAANVGSDSIYEVEVTVSDGNSGTAAQLITVSVTDENEAPVITSNSGAPTATLYVNENQIDVTTVRAVDQDASDVSYYSVNGLDASAFTIDSDSGVLVFNRAPDHETRDRYVVEVHVADNGAGTLSDVQTLTVFVNDVDEPPIAIADTLAGHEDTMLLIDPVLDLVGNDVDPEGGQLSLDSFIDPESGTLLWAEQGFLEYRPDADFNGIDTFEYQVADSAGNVASATVSIDVASVNDLPVLSQGSQSGSSSAHNIIDAAELTDGTTEVPENETIVGQAVAVDVDGDILSFALAGPDASVFEIDATSGMLRSIEPLDFEQPRDADEDNRYELELVITDGVGEQTRIELVVNATDTNEMPQLVQRTFTIDEGFSGELGRLIAIDSDADEELVFELIDGGPNSQDISLTTDGLILTSGLVPGNYEIDVLVRDSGDLVSFGRILIKVEPLSDGGLMLGAAIPAATQVPSLTSISTSSTLRMSIDHAPAKVSDAAGQPPDAMSLFVSSVAIEPDSLRRNLVSDMVQRSLANSEPVQSLVAVLSRSIQNDDSQVKYSFTNDFNLNLLATYDLLLTITELVHNSFDEFDEFDEQRQESNRRITLVVGIGSFTITIGFTAWLLSSNALLATAFSTASLWRSFDPLPVLSSEREKKDDFDEEFEGS